MADVTLPQLGETVTEGTITQWFKQIGDAVTADEPLFEVSTDKVDTEVPSPVSGTLLEIRVPEGETVDVGTVIAVVGDPSDADAPSPDQPAPEPSEQPAPEQPAPEQPAPEQPAPEQPAPEQPAPKQPAPAADADRSASPPPPPPPPPAPAPQPVSPEPATAEPRTEDASVSSSPNASDSRLLSPVVRRLVNEHGIDPSSINGTGPGGRITREDVLDHIDTHGQATKDSAPPARSPEPAAAQSSEPQSTQAQSSAPAAAAPARPSAPTPTSGERDTSIKLSKIRRLTGDHMVMSKSRSPHAFSVVEVDFANVDATRSSVKDEWKQTEGFGLTYLPFISRAIIDSLADFPHLNASVGDDELVVHDFIDLGIAVDLDYEGLLAPVIRSAETKRLRAIAREISDLAARAKARKLSPDEIQGGTFTISNNGSAGSVLTMPIINQPQVAIVSTDAIARKPVAIELADGTEAIVVHPVGNLAMSWDHRAFDGAYAAGFLKQIKSILETRDWGAEL
jgi:pyruvate dehydrogenase E2 component (dihydrolipoamide acetyltransferase)